MRNHKKKQQLLDYLDRFLFDPVFASSLERIGEREIGAIEDVQTLMRAERDRLRQEESALDVRERFLRNADEELYRDPLRAHGLPTFTDLRGEFLSLCRRLHVEPILRR